MKQIYPCCLSILCLLLSYSSNAQDSTTVAPNDLKHLTGCWSGTISYLDYGTGKSFSMPARLKVSEIEPSDRLWSFFNSYPEEPKANGADTLEIAADGKKLDQGTVVSVKRTPGAVVIITDQLAVDGNDDKPAVLRHTYTITASSFTRKKEVQFVGSSPWIKRNEFSYSKVRCE